MAWWPAWLVLSSPLTWGLWLVNRLATWTSLFYFWRRFRGRRLFWVWTTLINAASLSALGLLFFLLHRHPH